MEQGVDGLLRDKTRPSRIPALGTEVAERVVALKDVAKVACSGSADGGERKRIRSLSLRPSKD